MYKKEKKEFLNFIKSFRFTNDWFSNNIPVWISILKKKDKNEKLKILEIGSYEGMSAIFFLKYFNNAEIDCVETFKGSDEHAKKNFELVKKNFEYNLLDFKNRYNIFETTSDNFFEIKSDKEETYDIIYVDGSHESYQVSKDTENSFNKLKSKGFIIFDDFLRKYYDNISKNPFSAIINFIIKNDKKVKVIYFGYQLILQKY